MSEPLFPALSFAPAKLLRLGATVRIQLATEPVQVEGTIKSVDSRGLSVVVTRKFIEIASDWTSDEERLRRMRWTEIEGIWIRGRALGRGALWAGALALAFGWCGAEVGLAYVGLVFGLVLGATVIVWGHEWHPVDPGALP